MDEAERRAIRRRRRTDRFRAVTLILGASAVIIAVVVVSSLSGTFDLAQAWLMIGVALVAAWTARRGSARQEKDSDRPDPGAPTGHTESDVSGGEFTDIAFSRGLPTRRGWKRDVGIAYVDRSRLLLDGLNGRLTVDAPFSAVVTEVRYSYWPLVEVTGTIDAVPESTTYLAVRGHPRSKFSARPDEIALESEALAAAIRAAGGVT